ncbi:hypothetical protein ASE90_00030 [Sphingomonas sp. Leaf67]|uniref:response regulator n=1 Tax=unclassified Sphingomonas TaxID=196159 RepID=UPI0006F6EB24|nr:MULTISPECIES: response regulator [unclassified Sphingomonas]KQN78471.1 hypothetical protein ASE91_13670 [Sphingomonas sp. Leaf62]KQN91273.1 hypothetical protein ASE90_00030 [Sphingomonas sp. Leaf67]
MTAAPFTAVIIEDEPFAIEGVRRFCARSGQVRIVGEAVDAPTALDLITETRPQVVFLDIAMPGLSGLEVAAEVCALPTPPRIVFITAHDHFAKEAFDLAVVDYVLKPIVPERI